MMSNSLILHKHDQAKSKTMGMKQREKKESRKLIEKLHDRYRLVIMNDATLEEKLNFRLTRFNVFITVGTASIFLIVATIYLIAFTPLKEFIPGYADFNTRKVLRELSLRADSLERDLRQKDLYILNIRNIVEGRDMLEEIPDTVTDPTALLVEHNPISREDSMLRAEMQQISLYENNRWLSNDRPAFQQPGAFSFFPPIQGMISRHFNLQEGHLGIDIVAGHDETIKATLDGTVILSSWTVETGYTIAVQHNNNLLSIYKHNSSLLKAQGDMVEAGEAIAIIGDTGLYSTGTHLHFELWFHGNPINPFDYIVFE